LISFFVFVSFVLKPLECFCVLCGSVLAFDPRSSAQIRGKLF
jgi:hypothetical protein